VDLHHAAVLLGSAEALADRPRRAHLVASEAMGVLASGAVLPDYPDDRWLRPARARHATLLRQARLVVARTAILVGDPSRAVEAAQAAVHADPLDEAAYRMLMTAAQAAGEPARAVRAFQRLRAVLARELGIDPAASTQDLLVSILRENTSSTAEHAT
jgi:DNA-binding SARP family transcriptional activator